MRKPDSIQIEDFTYALPDTRIAQYPLAERDTSKLLVYRNNTIHDEVFTNLENHLPSDSLLIFNNTRVVRARLLFKKESGSLIEIFCLEPHEPREIQTMFQQKEECVWKCLVGNNKRWKENALSLKFSINNTDAEIHAEKISEENGTYLIRFSWNPPQLTFSEVLEHSGHIPLPPYMKRSDEPDDIMRYQTIYARNNGSVAAPTAGLHFTDNVMHSLQLKNIQSEYLTLHVGAGTFKPVTDSNALNHTMHSEAFIILKSTIESLYKNSEKHWTVVGTTSARTLESIFWLGIQLKHNNFPNENNFFISQWEAFESPDISTTRKDVLQTILDFMNRKELDSINGFTQIMIVPGYTYKMCDALVTNFHQPGSTLILLVSALIGNNWKQVYDHALTNDYRFLSYGDCCLFFPHEL
jgi:S-adenosylmethionine:tRNA ribosyltransferase-isomerase